MRPSFWRIGVEVAFLLICLVVGLVLGMRFAPRPIIGTMRFEGLIVPPSAQQMWNILEAARRDSRVAGIVVEISSFGGDASSSEKLYHAMAKFRQEKPLVVVIDSEATSGGYYAAIAANKIYAPAAAAVGNIGVWMSRPTDPMIVPEVLSTGPYKLGGGSRFDNIRQLEMVKDAFVTTVLHERTRSPYNPLRIDGSVLGEGHIYLGSEALALGMVDALGGISDAIADVAALAGVEQYEVRDLTEYLGLPFQPVDPFQMLSALRHALPGEVLLLDTRFIPLTHQEIRAAPLEAAPDVVFPGVKRP
ncbi:MAG: hypothetical protein DDG58_04195 [Ardenticatenia bacterium]|jgi:protease-4|nr:MAG: hypothetical protein DDG58_04195 [Ardenticatenia bacterium]